MKQKAFLRCFVSLGSLIICTLEWHTRERDKSWMWNRIFPHYPIIISLHLNFLPLANPGSHLTAQKIENCRCFVGKERRRANDKDGRERKIQNDKMEQWRLFILNTKPHFFSSSRHLSITSLLLSLSHFLPSLASICHHRVFYLFVIISN